MLIDTSAADPASFEREFGQALQGLRGALIELAGCRPDLPEKPYPLAQALGINKNLAWRLVQVMRSQDLLDMVRHLPGETGMGRVLEAYAGLDAPPELLAAVEGAVARYDEVVTRHAGGRRGLEAMLAGLAGTQPDAAQQAASRKQAFEGNAATLGVQARTMFAGNVLAPRDGDASVLDVATFGGLVGFRRLRPDVTWPLCRMRAFAEEGDFRMGPLHGGEGPPLLPDLCSHPELELVPDRDPERTIYSIPAGPIGLTAETDWAFGLGVRGLGSAYADELDGVVEFQHPTRIPAEAAVFDLLVHRDLPFVGPPRSLLVSLMCDQPAFPMSQHATRLLPLVEPVEELGEPAVVASPRVPRMRELVELACARMGWSPADFRGYRLTLEHPPIPASALLVYDQLSGPAS